MRFVIEIDEEGRATGSLRTKMVSHVLQSLLHLPQLSRLRNGPLLSHSRVLTDILVTSQLAKYCPLLDGLHGLPLSRNFRLLLGLTLEKLGPWTSPDHLDLQNKSVVMHNSFKERYDVTSSSEEKERG